MTDVFVLRKQVTQVGTGSHSSKLAFKTSSTVVDFFTCFMRISIITFFLRVIYIFSKPTTTEISICLSKLGFLKHLFHFDVLSSNYCYSNAYVFVSFLVLLIRCY